MKKTILEALKTKYKNLGLSEKSFESVASILEDTVKEETEIENAISNSKVETLLKTFQGESDQLRTAKQKAKELEDKIKALNGNPDPDPKSGDDPKPANDTPEWAKALLGTVKSLSDEIGTLKGEKLQTSRQQELNKILEKLPENLRKPYQRMDLKSFSDEDFKTHLTEIETEVSETVTDLSQKGAVFSTPKVGSGTEKEPDKKAQEEVFNNLKI